MADDEDEEKPEPKKPVLTAVVTEYPVETDASEVTITRCDLQNGAGSWPEVYGSPEQTKAFLRGVEATCQMFGIEFKTVRKTRRMRLPGLGGRD